MTLEFTHFQIQVVLPMLESVVSRNTEIAWEPGPARITPPTNPAVFPG